MAPTTNKYNSVVNLLDRPMPSWVKTVNDAARVAAYDAYDDMYANVPLTFRVVMRGDDEDNAIYVPSAMRIVEATNRYLAKDWRWVVRSASADAAPTTADVTAPAPAENERLAVQIALENLFSREEMLSKFYSLKRDMLKRGDGLLHVMFDESKPQGSRIKITELSARQYFPIPDPFDSEGNIGCYIVELLLVGTTTIARRIEYRKMVTPDLAAEFGVPEGGIYTRMTFWELSAWDDRYPDSGQLKEAAIPEAYLADPSMAPLLAGMALPDTVQAVPVYLFRNRRAGGDALGTSQISGVETLIAGINQGASDEDITLALQGIGIYVTTAKRPVDPDSGEEADWIIAPGAVLELQSVTDKFDRVSGVGSVQPFQDHLKYLSDKLDEGGGLSAVAVGKVDVAVASSGVALRLEMAPILAGNEEKEVELLSRLDQFLHDLLFMWMPLEGVTADPADITISNSFGDPLPTDRAATIAEVTALVTAGLMSKEFAVSYLGAKLGYQFPADMLTAIMSEADAVAARMAAELGAAPTAAPAGVGA